MLNYVEQDLIATYEELHHIPESERIMEYYGDFCLFAVKSRVPQERVIEALNTALSEIQLTRDDYNAIAERERFTSRINIIDYFKKHSVKKVIS